MRGLLPLSALLLSSCEVSPTQLVVAVRTDMLVPGELDAIRIEVEGAGTPTVEGPGQARYGAPIPLGGDVTLPATFGVAPRGGDADRRVTVRVSARAGGQELFETRAVTSFVEGEQLLLEMFLARGCIGVTCEDALETCTPDGCVDPEIDPRGLPDWDGTLPAAADASTPREDAGDGGGSAGGWPRLIAWADDDVGYAVAAKDVLVRASGEIWFFGHFGGTVTIDGDPVLGPRELTSQDARIWASCWTPAGAPCGLEVLGDGDGECLAPRAALDAQGRLLLSGMFAGAPDLAGVQLDDGGALSSATFVLRRVFDAPDAEVATIRADDLVAVDSLTAVPNGQVLLGLWASSSPLTFRSPAGEEMDLGVNSGPIAAGVLLDPALGALAVVPLSTDDPNFSAAATSNDRVARTWVTTREAGRGQVLVMHAGDESDATYTADSDCAALAAATSADGTSALACAVAGQVEYEGGTPSAPGDLWIGGYPPDQLGSYTVERLLTGAVVENVFDAAGGLGSSIVLAGTYDDAAGRGSELDPLPDAVGRDALIFGVDVTDAIAIEWVETVGSAGDDTAGAVAVDPTDGAIVVVGSLGGVTTIGGVEIGRAAGPQVWAHRFAPEPR